MRTITFYSYKGGVGRSLLVANAARYLSTLGKKVFALDLDLQAPGLHYKFELGVNAVHSPSTAGVVDILEGFLKQKSFPSSLEKFKSILPVEEGAGPIQIMMHVRPPMPITGSPSSKKLVRYSLRAVSCWRAVLSRA